MLKKEPENNHGKRYPFLSNGLGICTFILVGYSSCFLRTVCFQLHKRKNQTLHYRGVWMGGAHEVMTADPANIEYMLRTNFRNFPKGKYYRERFQDLLGDGIFNADGELWTDQRQRAKAEMHSSRFIDHSIQTMQDLVHLKLLKLTEKLVKSGDRFDIQEILPRFMFDNICTAACGVDPGCLNLDFPEAAFAKAFEAATEFTLFRFLTPPLVWKSMKFLGIGYEKRLREAIRIVHEFADETVKDRRNNLIKLGSLNDQSDLLSRLMDIEYTENCKNQEFPDKYFRDFCVSFILAGRETTSVALAWFFWLVNQNPEVENKILCEINEILGNRNCKNKKDGIIFTVEELKKMVYLQAALSESMRLYPSLPTEMKEVIEDNVLPDSSVLKKGARFSIAYSQWPEWSLYGGRIAWNSSQRDGLRMESSRVKISSNMLCSMPV